MEVQTHYYLTGLELAESVFYAVGDVRRYADLRLDGHVGGTARMLYMLHKAASVLLVLRCVDVVVDNIEGYEAPVQPAVAHERGESDEAVGIFGVLHGYENLLVVALVSRCRILLFVQSQFSCRIFRDDRRDDAREENHQNDTVENLIVEERMARRHL